ncbi:MAG: two-component system chemotaxis response regulator CheY [Myxococcota bacterium]|jgi:two-component system chemotaxis response regulator CheY
MIVDDSRVMRMMVRRTLRQAGFEDLIIFEAEHGRDAFDRYDDVRPDLILADWNMPEMGGFELLEKLMVYDPGVRLGFITSEQSDEIRTKAAEAGARFLLAKPFCAHKFRLKLGRFLSRDGLLG